MAGQPITEESHFNESSIIPTGASVFAVGAVLSQFTNVSDESSSKMAGGAL